MIRKNTKHITIGIISATLCLLLLTCACGKKEEPVESTTASIPTESPIEEITLTTSPVKENTNDGGIDGHLPAVDTSDEYVILSGHSLE